MQPAGHARSVRSYVMRAGRITEAQQRALSTIWPRYGTEFTPGALDLARVFGRAAACTLEIGFGNGEHLLERAIAAPERDFLGIEVHRPGIGHLLLAADKAGIANLRVIAHDAVEVLHWQIAPDSIAELQLLFPDPWPKTRHHKRRIVQPDFADLVASRLIPGGRFHLATDWEPYAQEMLAVLGACEALRNCAGHGFIDRVMDRAATRFERRGERLGHRVRELLFERPDRRGRPP
ncbi:MAG TPA: tRNA (guanosine(46)-N7)-methyltransferase TrmB [Steroidobacteraceae bacterium]